MTLRIIVADDHPMFREGLSALLGGEGDMVVVAAAATGAGAAEAAARWQPDIAILDLRMPGGGGLAAITAIRRTCTQTRILVLTSFDSGDEIDSALAAGAHGYLVKSAAPKEIVAAARAVAAGTAVVGDDVLARLTQRAASPLASRFPELTDREAAVLAAVTRGLSTEEAAATLGLTAKTVRNYIASITAKLGVRDRTAAVLVARDRGLGTADAEAPEPKGHA